MMVSASLVGANPNQITGKVLETMNSGGYTYVQIENPTKGKVWVAVPSVKVKVGQQISFLPGSVMQNFKSKSLGKTFDIIIFSTGVAK